MTLKQLAEAVKEKRYKDKLVPQHAIPNTIFRDNSAGELTKSILAYFELIGWRAYRQASEGRYIQGRKYTDMWGKNRQEKGMYIPRSKKAKGAGDISVTRPPYGQRVEVEVKIGRDKQSEVQEKFQKEIEDMGGIYLIARSWDGFFFEISKLVGEPRSERSTTGT